MDGSAPGEARPSALSGYAPTQLRHGAYRDSTFVPSFLFLDLRRNDAPPNVYLDPGSELGRVQRGVLQRLAVECSGLSCLESCPRLGAAARSQRSLEGT